MEEEEHKNLAKKSDKIQTLQRERQYLVVKSNDLIQDSRYNLSVQEQKIVLRLIQMIRPGDSEFKEYEFSIREFNRLCGIDESSGKNYAAIKKTIKNLADKSVYIRLPGTETEVLIRWIEKVYFEKNSGKVRIRLDEDMKPYLLQLHSRFTQFSLYYTLPMKSKYSIRLYELMKSFEQLHEPILKRLDELRKQLECQNYEKWNDLQRFVLVPACKEINEYTDIHVEYTTIKLHRAITHVVFQITAVSGEEKTKRLNSVGERMGKAELERSLEEITKQNEKICTQDCFLTAKSGTIPFYAGANKKDMEIALISRIDQNDLERWLSPSQKETWKEILQAVITLCCRKSKLDVIVDGGNKGNIMRVNDIIIKQGSLTEWFKMQAVRYDSSVFWKGKKEIKNPAAYLARCIEEDLGYSDSLFHAFQSGKSEIAEKRDEWQTVDWGAYMDELLAEQEADSVAAKSHNSSDGTNP